MFCGLDVHKEFVQVCRLSKDGRLRRDFRIPATEQALEAFARRLTSADQVALEATFRSWAIHGILAPRAGRVVVVHALQVEAIAHAKIKTDKVDARVAAADARLCAYAPVTEAAKLLMTIPGIDVTWPSPCSRRDGPVVPRPRGTRGRPGGTSGRSGSGNESGPPRKCAAGRFKSWWS